MAARQKGFTLIEVVIILVIMGLLMGGMVKGTELISNARVHSLISQQESIKAAYLGFRDRYQALPGDYSRASVYIGGVVPEANGNGNGLITPAGVAGAVNDEYIAAWDHLTKSGLLPGNYNYAPAPETPASAPLNVFQRYIQLTYDNAYGNGALAPSHNLKTGNYIPSDILSELDRKVDDGSATTGRFRFSPYAGGPGGAAPEGAGVCYAYTASGTSYWKSDEPVVNCGGTSLL